MFESSSELASVMEFGFNPCYPRRSASMLGNNYDVLVKMARRHECSVRISHEDGPCSQVVCVYRPLVRHFNLNMPTIFADEINRLSCIVFDTSAT